MRRMDRRRSVMSSGCDAGTAGGTEPDLAAASESHRIVSSRARHARSYRPRDPPALHTLASPLLGRKRVGSGVARAVMMGGGRFLPTRFAQQIASVWSDARGVPHHSPTGSAA